jgi:TetR/AcrR family transcriptional regulator, transcriptional repressor for nem operon
MKKGQAERVDTATQILDVAERLVQVRGFNGFSYADVAAELKITKAALHYHFAGKAELGEALVARYAARFAEALTGVEARTANASARLDAYADLYLDVLREQRMCLCGMMAAEYQTLPTPMQDAVVRFFEENERWLVSVLEKGRKDGTLTFAGPPNETARMIVSGLEGAMLVARPFGDITRFQNTARHLLSGLRSTPTRAPRSRNGSKG